MQYIDIEFIHHQDGFSLLSILPFFIFLNMFLKLLFFFFFIACFHYVISHHDYLQPPIKIIAISN